MSENADAPEVLAAVLLNKKVGGDPKDGENVRWPIFVGQLDTDPEEAIATFRAPSILQGRIQRGGQTISHDGVQIRVRGGSYKLASAKITEIERVLDSVKQLIITLEDKRYLVEAVNRVIPPVPMGPDDNKRLNFTINYSLTFRKV